MSKTIRFSHGAFGASLLGFAWVVLLAPATQAETPAKLEFESGWDRLYSLSDASRLNVYVSTITEDKDDRPYASGAHASLVLVENGAIALQYKVVYPDLRAGDLFPVMGRVYQVEAMYGHGPGGGKRGHKMTAKLVPPKDVAKGVTLGARTYVVPYIPGEQSGTLVTAEGNVRFVGLDRPKGVRDPAVIRLSIMNREEDSTIVRQARVIVGDVVLIGDKGYKVLSLTPPEEPKKVREADWRRVIGWIELDPKGIPEKELVEKKIPFVRPEKVATQKK